MTTHSPHSLFAPFLPSTPSVPAFPTPPPLIPIPRTRRCPRPSPRPSPRPHPRSSPPTSLPPTACLASPPPSNASLYEQVVAAVPLSSVFREICGDGAVIQKGPHQFIVVCPFHDDKNPSLSVNDAKKVFNCFACGTTGNLFTAEKKCSGADTVDDAILSLAARYAAVADIVAAAKNAPPAPRKPPPFVAPFAKPRALFSQPAPPPKRKWGDGVRERRGVRAALEAAHRYFVAQYQKHQEGSTYLESRGVSAEAAKAFGFGLAPAESGMTACLTYLTDLGISEEDCVAAGVAKVNKRGRVYDVFRNRLMLPIRDGEGRVLSFSGRLLQDSETEPKYINGPGSLVFEKKKTLFGLDMLDGSMHSPSKQEYGKVILVEGYMDVIALYDKGKDKVAAVASMGTAVSADQIRAGIQALGDKLQGKLIINLDGDDAGLAASIRLCETVLPLLENVSCVYIARPPPPFKDVGEYLESENASVGAYLAHLDREKAPALGWIEWRVSIIVQEVLDARDVEGSAVRLAQAAEIGAMGSGDDVDVEYLPVFEGGIGQSSSLSDNIRRENLLSLSTLKGETGDAVETVGSNRDVAHVHRGEGMSSEGLLPVAPLADGRGKRRMERLVSAESSIARGELYDDALATKAASSSSTEVGQPAILASSEAKIAGCPISVLDEIATFVAKAVRLSPGLNLPMLVHRWSDSLSGGTDVRHTPVLFENIMRRIDVEAANWTKNSPSAMMDTMPPPPWQVDEMPKWERERLLSSSQPSGGDKPSASTAKWLMNKKNVEQMDKRLQLQEKLMEPHLERQKAPASLRMRSKPRAAAEEIILRTLIWAEPDPRLDALEELVSVMVDVESAGLLPFWTENREELFTYILELEDELTVEEMAAECELKAWWIDEIEFLFVPPNEFGDDELSAIHELGRLEPVMVVKQTACAVQEMAAKVATGLAVEQLGEYLAAQVGENGKPGSATDVTPQQIQGMMDAISGVAFSTPAEQAAMEEAAALRMQDEVREKQMKEIERRFAAGESLGAMGDWSDKSGTVAVDVDASPVMLDDLGEKDDAPFTDDSLLMSSPDFNYELDS